MTLPEFNKRGTLNKGIHQCTSGEFIERFCYGDSTIRSKYIEVLEQLFAFCLSRGGKSIIVGGSFITNKEKPSDLDCMIILPNDKCCTMQSNEFLCIDGCEIDIMVLAESNKELIYLFLNLFSQDKYDLEVGMVEIILDEETDQSTWNDYKYYFSVEKLFEARESYINRHIIRGVKKRKLLVTILNFEKYMFFNYDISPIVSTAGYTFAPYVYFGKNIPSDYSRFKDWITDLYNMYETEISVFADGIGTYLLGLYLKDDPKTRFVTFDKIILSEALLISDFDWIKEKNRINLIVNLKDVANKSTAEKDIPSAIKGNPVYGNAYKTGFKQTGANITELNYDYTKRMNLVEFQNTIFPIYNMSSIIEENVEEIFNDSFAEIMTKQISAREVIFGK